MRKDYTILPDSLRMIITKEFYERKETHTSIYIYIVYDGACEQKKSLMLQCLKSTSLLYLLSRFTNKRDFLPAAKKAKYMHALYKISRSRTQTHRSTHT